MIPELKTAARVISARLRQHPYQRGVTITAWDAIIEQRANGKRYGAFSWYNALAKEVDRYISELDDATKQRIWDATEDCDVTNDADMATITKGLYPYIFDAAGKPIHRAVRYQQRKSEGEP